MYIIAKVSEGFFNYFMSIKAFTDGSAIWLRLAAFFRLLQNVCWYKIRTINKSNLQLSRVHIIYRSANSPSVGFVYYFMSFWNWCNGREKYVLKTVKINFSSTNMLRGPNVWCSMFGESFSITRVKCECLFWKECNSLFWKECYRFWFNNIGLKTCKC